jgi:hypothetical protein
VTAPSPVAKSPRRRHYKVSTKEGANYQDGRFRITRQPGTPGLPVRARLLLSA